MASGNGGKIAISKIGSLYTDVSTADKFFSFTDETLEHTLDELEEGAITGRRDAPNSYKGLDMGKGDINFEPNPETLGHILYGWFGTIATSVVDVGSAANTPPFSAEYFHRFTPSNVSFSDRTFLAPYNVAVYRDVQSAFLFKQSIFTTVKLMFKANALVKATGTLMGRTVDLFDYTAGMNSLVSSGGRPWLWDMASVEYSSDTTTGNLAARTDFEEFNVTFDLPHDGVPLLDGTKKYAEFTPSDFRRIKFDGSMSFRDEDAYTAFKNYEEHYVRATLLNVNSLLTLGDPSSADATAFLGYPGLRLNIPAFKFTSWSAPIKGPNRISAAFNGKAEFNQSAGYTCAVDLLNSTNSTDYTTAH
jgi:hypothetical protein